MAQILSYSSHDYMPIIILPVIASFNEDGQIKPLYVGIDGECCKVDSYWIRRSFANQIEFHCKIICDYSYKNLIITYFMNECLWTIPRI